MAVSYQASGKVPSGIAVIGMCQGAVRINQIEVTTDSWGLPGGIALGDVTNDGHLDIALNQLGGISAHGKLSYTSFLVAYGDGAGGFTLSSVGSGIHYGGGYSAALGDVDGNGSLDFALVRAPVVPNPSPGFSYRWPRATARSVPPTTGTEPDAVYARRPHPGRGRRRGPGPGPAPAGLHRQLGLGRQRLPEPRHAVVPGPGVPGRLTADRQPVRLPHRRRAVRDGGRGLQPGRAPGPRPRGPRAARPDRAAQRVSPHRGTDRRDRRGRRAGDGRRLHEPAGPDAGLRTPDVERSRLHGLYRDVLNREADATGLRFWEQQMAAGTDRDLIVAAFWNSTEHRTLQVDAFYANYLGRQADADGRAFWAAALQAGLGEAGLARRLLASAEFAAGHPDDASFVSGLYRDVLGRTADPAGQAAWDAALAEGAGRDTVADRFLTAPGDDRLIDQCYARYLQGQAEVPATAAWLEAFEDHAWTAGRLAQTILASDEYFAAHG